MPRNQRRVNAQHSQSYSAYDSHLTAADQAPTGSRLHDQEPRATDTHNRISGTFWPQQPHNSQYIKARNEGSSKELAANRHSYRYSEGDHLSPQLDSMLVDRVHSISCGSESAEPGDSFSATSSDISALYSSTHPSARMQNDESMARKYAIRANKAKPISTGITLQQRDAQSNKEQGRRQRGSSAGEASTVDEEEIGGEDGASRKRKVQRRNRYKRCHVEGCTKYARKGGACVEHGGVAARCKVEKCTKQAVNGGVCRRHGAKRTEYFKCAAPGCSAYITARPGKCLTHRLMEAYSHCSVEECPRYAKISQLCIYHHREEAARQQSHRQVVANTPHLQGWSANSGQDRAYYTNTYELYRKHHEDGRTHSLPEAMYLVPRSKTSSSSPRQPSPQQYYHHHMLASDSSSSPSASSTATVCTA